MLTVRVVPRPEDHRSKYPVQEVIRTAETGQAVRIALPKRMRPLSVVSAMHKLLSRQGYKFCYRRQEDGLVAWAERKSRETA